MELSLWLFMVRLSDIHLTDHLVSKYGDEKLGIDWHYENDVVLS